MCFVFMVHHSFTEKDSRPAEPVQTGGADTEADLPRESVARIRLASKNFPARTTRTAEPSSRLSFGDVSAKRLG